MTGEPSVREPRKREPRKRDAATQAPPNRASLHEAALAYLARGAASAESVKKTLERRCANWVRRAVRAGLNAEAVALMDEAGYR